MQIQRLTIKNFKKFRECQIDFDPHFNLFVGDNATGKTSVLDALAIAIDSWFLGMRTAERAGGIDGKHVNLLAIPQPDSTTFEKQFPAVIDVQGLVQGQPIQWVRELLREGGKTTTGRTKEIVSLAEQADQAVREGKKIVLPLICSYGAERLWYESLHHKPKKKDDITPRRPSRFDGYRDCTAFNIQETDLITWMQAELSASRQRGTPTLAWSAVKGAILSCVEYTTEVFFDDLLNEFIVRMENLGDQVFSNLSDGQRIMLTLIGDLVRRIMMLNPHLGDKALLETPGVVLIDELDLHLHPKWQRRVIHDLKRTFPCVQFVATTHSPQLIGEALPDEICILENGGVFRPKRSFGVDSSEILEEVMKSNRRNIEIDRLLKGLSELIDQEDITRARQVLSQVEARLGANDPEVTGANTLINLLESTR
ncbi:MAG TPA: AAA family ATPase [Candidatus Angelobacter sp.]|nr:AAA family ATPase [Candidatus Angelobacter sp.]